jgi:hypothetical protein
MPAPISLDLRRRIVQAVVMVGLAGLIERVSDLERRAEQERDA